MCTKKMLRFVDDNLILTRLCLWRSRCFHLNAFFKFKVLNTSFWPCVKFYCSIHYLIFWSIIFLFSLIFRYKKLLCTVDLTKDFFFSYSYHIMRSLQRNMCGAETGHVLYETMFVWNEFLTRGIRNHLQNTFWTVALVYGFFKQVTK